VPPYNVPDVNWNDFSVTINTVAATVVLSVTSMMGDFNGGIALFTVLSP
jgi:hypothetical protein